MSGGGKEPSAARAVVPILAIIVLAATILAMLLTVGLRPMCEYSAECYRDADWSLVRGGISIVLAVGAILVASRARTAQILWSGGVLLLIGAVAASPVLAFLAG
jgi:hypothetical protein